MIQSTYFSPVFWNSLRFKRGPNFQGWGGKPIFQNNWIAWIEGAWFLGRNQAFLKNSWIIWSPLLYFDFKTFNDPNSSSFIRFPFVLYNSEDFFCHALEISTKEGGPNFSEEPILQKVWIIWSTLLYFNFKNLMDPNSSSFIRFQCILHDSGVIFSKSWNFCKLRRGDLIYWGTQFCKNSELFGHPVLYFNFKGSKYLISSSLIRLQCILHDSAILFLESWNYYKLKKVNLISGGNQFCRKSELFGQSSCIWISKVLYTKVHRHSLDFNAFCIIQEEFFQSLEISTN